MIHFAITDFFEFSSDYRDKRHHKPSKTEFLEIDWATNKPSRIQKNSVEKIKNYIPCTPNLV